MVAPAVLAPVLSRSSGWSVLPAGFLIRVCPMFQEKFCHFEVPFVNRRIEGTAVGCIAFLRHVGIGAAFEKQPHDLQLSPISGKNQWRSGSVLSHSIHKRWILIKNSGVRYS